MLSKKKVKGKWQYFEDGKRISEYEFIIKTEVSREPEEIPAFDEASLDAKEEVV